MTPREMHQYMTGGGEVAGQSRSSKQASAVESKIPKVAQKNEHQPSFPSVSAVSFLIGCQRFRSDKSRWFCPMAIRVKVFFVVGRWGESLCMLAVASMNQWTAGNRLPSKFEASNSLIATARLCGVKQPVAVCTRLTNTQKTVNTPLSFLKK